MTADRSEFVMPSLGADMESGTVSEWLVKPGEKVRKGDIIAVIDTDKALIEVECFRTGVVERLLVGTGERVPVGTALALIDSTAEPAAPRSPAEEPSAPTTPPPVTKAPKPRKPRAKHPVAGNRGPVPAPRPEIVPSVITSPLVRHLAERRGVDVGTIHGTGPGGRITRADVEHAGFHVRVSPLARRIARELGVDLTGVHGTGRTGAIRADDVRTAAAREARPSGEAARAAPTPAQAVGEPDPEQRRNAMRQAIARAMARSKREIPHYYLSTTVDMAAALGWLRERNRDLPVAQRLLPAALLLKAAARAAVEVPRLNGFWIDDSFVPGDEVHLGVAISLKGGGLIAPAIHDATGRDLGDLMAALKDLAARSRTGRLRGAEMTEATITVTNLGDQGVEAVHGVIYPPQVALVGFGKIVERPWAVNGLLGVRPLVTVTLAADHRATDGYTGGRFLTAVDRLLNRPEEL